MKPIDELLRNLRRPEVLEFALASERLPCVKVGASFQPVDGGAPTTDQVLEMLVAAGGSRYVDALNDAPTRWSFRLEGVGVIGISAVLRGGVVQARFTLTKREAPSRHDSATMTAAAPVVQTDNPSPIGESEAERHPSDDDEPTMVSQVGDNAASAAPAPQVIVKSPVAAPAASVASGPSIGSGSSAKPVRKETPRSIAAAKATALKAQILANQPPPAAAKPAEAGKPSNVSALTGSARSSPAAPPPAAAASMARPLPGPSPQAVINPHKTAPSAASPNLAASANVAAKAPPAPAPKPPPPSPESVTTTTVTAQTVARRAAEDDQFARPKEMKAAAQAPVPEEEDPASSVEHARIFPTGGEAPPAAAQARSQPTAQTPSPIGAGAASPAAGAKYVQRANSPSSLRDLLSSARQMSASDLHVVAGRPPLLRLAGELLAHGSPIEPAEVERMARSIVPARLAAALEQDGSCDFAFDEEGLGRFRCNVSRQRTGYKISLRLIPPGVPTLATLGLPPEIGQATHHHQGLIVITGPTGHGKTTTLAALVDLINSDTTHHIITVEDPVEYVHPRKRATMSQREVGTHTKTFAAALKASLRQDPDVVVVGELRDTETVRMALSASETGHLVLGTMNTPSAAKTIDRLIDLFPPADQAQVRATLAGGLRMIVSQRLVPSGDRRSMVAVAELLPGSTALYTLIRDNKTFQIPSLQQRGRGAGMLRLDDSLADLVRAGKTSIEIARAAADSPDELDAQLRANPPSANVQAAAAASAAQAGAGAKPGQPGAGPGSLGTAPPAAPGVKAPQGSLFQRAGSLFNSNKKE